MINDKVKGGLQNYVKVHRKSSLLLIIIMNLVKTFRYFQACHIPKNQTTLKS